MKLSYAITVCSELEVKNLIDLLCRVKKDQDEICALLDTPKAPPELLHLLHTYSSNKEIILKESEFKGHFADWKNELTSICTGDYIFQIDADELVDEFLVFNLATILESNLDCDVFFIPRINTVTGITQEHINQWNWEISKSETYKDERIFDLENSNDFEQYSFLKKYDLIIEESKL